MGLFDSIKKKTKKRVAEIKTNATVTPTEFKRKDKFVPIKKDLYEYDREYIDLIKLALSENEECKIENGPKYSLDLEKKMVTLPIRWYTNAQRKSATLHAAAHMSITPSNKELEAEERASYRKTKQVADLIEDVRVNRYLCYKYPGLLRYIREDKQEIMKDLSIGDFDEECQIEDDKYNNGGQLGKAILKRKEEIRNCETYSDVLEVSKKLLEDMEDESKKEKCQCPTPQKAVAELLGLKDKDSKSPKEIVQKTVNFGERSGITPALNWEEDEGNEECKPVKVEPEYFLDKRSEQQINPYPLNKGLLKLLQKRIPLRRKTRDGRLTKIDPVRMITDQKVFTRNTNQKKQPHFYFILDCSGSMSSDKMQWLKDITKTMINLLKRAGLQYTLLAHSGEHDKFYYSEIKEKDLRLLRPQHYNLDGSMLRTLFSEYIDANKNNVVFYLSDGGLPAEFPEYEAPLIVKYISKAKSMNIPIIGIGLQTQHVKIFNDWYVITGVESLTGAIKKMSNKILARVG